MEKTTHCIITRYNEYIDWIKWLIKDVDHMYIYNKGSNDDLFKYTTLTEEDKAKITIERLPNIGRIDHTLVYHILNKPLPDNLISLPGSILMCEKKGAYLSAIQKKIKIYREKYNGFYSPRFHRTSNKYNYTIDNYQAEGYCNRNNNTFVKSEYKDFQTWKLAIIDDLPMKYIAMRGMFIVAKENINHIDKSIYLRLLESLSVGDNIENGHFAERIWAHLFRQHSLYRIKQENKQTCAIVN